jgi:hypothetical protein
MARVVSMRDLPHARTREFARDDDFFERLPGSLGLGKSGTQSEDEHQQGC